MSSPTTPPLGAVGGSCTQAATTPEPPHWSISRFSPLTLRLHDGLESEDETMQTATHGRPLTGHNVPCYCCEILCQPLPACRSPAKDAPPGARPPISFRRPETEYDLNSGFKTARRPAPPSWLSRVHSWQHHLRGRRVSVPSQILVRCRRPDQTDHARVAISSSTTKSKYHRLFPYF